MASDQSVNEEVKPLGLVPLYPFPSLYNSSKSLVPKQSSHLTQVGSFLPPIFNSFYSAPFDEEIASIEAERVLAEVITEEILDIYENLFTEGGNFLEEVLEKEFKEEKALKERVTKSVARELLEDVITEACRSCVIAYLDDVIENHVNEIEARLCAETYLLDFETEFLNEIATEVVEVELYGKECFQIVQEVISEDVCSIAEEALIHYGARLAFSQYKQVAQFASENILDQMCLQALLPKAETQVDLTYILDDMMFSILLHKTLELNESTKEEPCLPLLWYRKNLLQNILLDVTLDELDELNDVT